MNPAAVLPPTAVSVERDRLEAAGCKLVFTNGCFDILHAGHVRYLQQARSLGDALVVALNDDDSVRSLKGPSRPVNPLDDRAEVLAALRCVDYVTFFSGPRVEQLLRDIRPHVYAKGGDYTLDTLHSGERAVLEELGVSIELLPLVPGRSTTNILSALKQS